VEWTERRTNESILQEIGEIRRCLVIDTESHKTEDDVFRARNEGGWSGEGDDVGVWRGEETAKENVDGGDSGRNGDVPGGAKRSGEESERVEDADYDSC